MDELEDYSTDYVECPACETEQHTNESVLGFLGEREHHKCRYCGMEFSRESTH